jgi:hypothetical protein
VTLDLLVLITDRRREHVVAALESRLHLLQGLSTVLEALELPLRGNDGLDELALGRVLEFEVQTLDGCAVCR